MNIKNLNGDNKDFYIFSTNLNILKELKSQLNNNSHYLNECINFIENLKGKFDVEKDNVQLLFSFEEGFFNNKICAYINKNGNIIDNFLPIKFQDLLHFNIYNIAPYSAFAIAIYEQDENKLPIGNPKGYILLDNLKTIFGKRLYRVGLCSDIHYNDGYSDDADPDTHDDDGSEFYNDSINFLDFYQNKEEVDFIAVSGDVGTDSLVHDTNFKLLMDKYAPTTPLYSCYGNHDYCAANKNEQLIEDWSDNYGNKTRRESWNFMMVPQNSKYEIHHYDDDITSKGYSNYWFEVPIEGTNKSDIYLFLSVDYYVNQDNTENTLGWGCQMAQHIINYGDNETTNQIFEYVYDNDIDECINRNENCKQYDYQFYDNGVLLWFKNILETYSNKRIFIFTHQFFVHKTGNNNSGSYYNYAADDWRISRADNGHGAYCLCGIQFEFLNKLNNEYSNTIWFTGHSHYKWEWQRIDTDINISNVEYNYVRPNYQEYLDNPSSRYLRTSKNIINKNTAYNIHIPSTCRPIQTYSWGYGISGESSQGAIMDIYENYVDIRGIVFKEDFGPYINKYLPIAQYRIPIKAN